MSTRCNIIVKSGFKAIQLYRHSDGYPNSEHGVVAGLKDAMPFAWNLPRMEADDFAAAIVRAWKERGGNIYIDGNHESDADLHGDIEYIYEISPDEKIGRWTLKVYGAQSCENGVRRGQTLFSGHIGDSFNPA